MLHLLGKLRTNLPKLVLSLLILCLAFGVSGLQPLASLAAGPDGSVDPTFLSGSGFNDSVNAIVVQGDGKILIGGGFTTYNSTGRSRIARFNSDSSIDTSFLNSGTGANNTVNTLAMQPDGKILIGGGFTTYNGTGRTRLARLNPDGSLDTSFDPGTGANVIVQALAVQADGKVIIGGWFTNYNGVSRNRIARLNPDGSLDTSFNPGTGANNYVYALAVQPDGKVLIGGLFTSYNGTGRNGIARLNPDGSLDTSFLNSGTGTNSDVLAIALQPDGKVLIGGSFTIYNGTPRNNIARLNPDGSLDTSFNPGTGANNTVLTLTVQPDGKVLIGGWFTTYNGASRNRIARLNSDGSLDTSFNPGTGTNSTVSTIAVQPDGKVLIGGWFTTYNGTPRNNIARLNPDGSLDTSFLKSSRGANYFVHAIAVQADGKVLIGGLFATYNDTSRNRITRLNPDGSLDTSFDPGTGANDIVYAIAVQGDGKILIAGYFNTYNGTPRNNIARLNPDGSLDTSFLNSGTGANSDVLAIALQPDGKVLIGGKFTTYNGTTRNNIARLNADGSLDTSFDPGTGANSYVQAIGVQADGKILIGGAFTNYNGTTRNHIARLNADGSLDTSFDPGTGANTIVQALAMQADGKVFIGGGFTIYNEAGRNKIARLNADGSLDTSFDPGTGANSSVVALTVQADGKVLIGGYFTIYNETGRNKIARLNADGSLDTSFDPGTGANNDVHAIVLQPDGKILIGGVFTAVDTYTRDFIARLENTLVKTPSSITVTSTPNPSTVGQTATFTATVSPLAATGTVTFTIGMTNVTASLSGGVATYVTSTLPVGQTPVTAAYGGDTNLLPSITPAVYTHTVTKAASSITVTSAPNPSTVGQTATFTATVNPAMAIGTVTFTIGSTDVTATLSGGVATYVTNTLPIGSYGVTTTYGGSAVYSGSVSSGQYTHTVVACDPLVVTIGTDNGVAGTCGTFSYAVLNATSGMTITFSVPNVTFTSVLTPSLQAGVVIDGSGAGANGVILDGGTLAGDGLTLGGNNRLINLTVKGFNGRGLVVSSGKTNNKLDRIRVVKT